MAALHIVSYHLLLLAQPDLGRLPGWAVGVAQRGYTSTSLFFILSGFVLTYAYSDKETGFRGDDRSFWIGRWARLYPILVLTYLISLPLSDDTPGQAVVRGFLTLTGLQSWVPVPGYSLGSVSWSLSALALFYALTPWLLRRTRGTSSRHLVMLLGAAWAAALVAPAILMAWSDQPVGAQDPRMQVIHTFPLLRLPEFVFGVVLGRLFLRAGDSRSRWTTVALGAAAAILAGVFMFGGRLPYPLLHNGALAPLHGILIVGLASGAGPVGRLLASGGMRALGDASLPLYLLHIPLLTYVAGWVEGHGAGSMSMMAFVLAGYMAGLIALSLAASRWIVEPGALYIRRRLTPPKGSAPVPAVPAPSPQTSPLVAEGAAA